MIVVAASDQNNALASFSNYGATNVDLVAPGLNIYSLMPSAVVSPPLAMGSSSYSTTPLEFSGTTTTAGITAKLYNCGIGNTGQFPSAVNGKIALIQRGSLNFSVKVTNAMNAGANAVVIWDNITETSTNFTLGTPGTWIPSLAISLADGTTLNSLTTSSPVTATLKIPARYQYL